jgi:hypothetical protein
MKKTMPKKYANINDRCECNDYINSYKLARFCKFALSGNEKMESKNKQEKTINLQNVSKKYNSFNMEINTLKMQRYKSQCGTYIETDINNLLNVEYPMGKKVSAVFLLDTLLRQRVIIPYLKDKIFKTEHVYLANFTKDNAEFIQSLKRKNICLFERVGYLLFRLSDESVVHYIYTYINKFTEIQN